MEEEEDGGGSERENPMQFGINGFMIYDAGEGGDDGHDDDDDDDSVDSEELAALKNPIFRAYYDNEPLEVVLSIIEDNPGLVRDWDGHGWSLLHSLVDDIPRPTLPGVIRRIVEIWPGSVQEWTKSVTLRFLPLHLACRYNFSEDSDDEEMYRYDAIRILVEAWPGAVRLMSSKGKYPLDSCSYVPKLNVIRCLVEVWPQAIDQAYQNGSFLLHKAADSVNVYDETEALDIIRYFLEQRPQSIRDIDCDGRLALHNAVESGSVNAVGYLVEAWREPRWTVTDPYRCDQ